MYEYACMYVLYIRLCANVVYTLTHSRIFLWLFYNVLMMFVQCASNYVCSKKKEKNIYALRAIAYAVHANVNAEKRSSINTKKKLHKCIRTHLSCNMIFFSTNWMYRYKYVIFFFSTLKVYILFSLPLPPPPMRDKHFVDYGGECVYDIFHFYSLPTEIYFANVQSKHICVYS